MILAAFALAAAPLPGDEAVRLAEIKERIALANREDCPKGCGRAVVAWAGEPGAWAYDGWIVVQVHFMRMLSDDALALVVGHEMAHIRGIRGQRAADREGIRMAARAGYDEAAMRTFAALVRPGLLARLGL